MPAGVYLGWPTPTEVAAVDAAGTELIAVLNMSIGWCVVPSDMDNNRI